MDTIESGTIEGNNNNNNNCKEKFDFFCIVSYISWLSLGGVNFFSFIWLYNSDEIWSIKIITNYEDHKYIPLQMFFIMIYVIFLIASVLIFMSCIYLIIKTLFKKDEQLRKKMMEKFTKFQFIPFFCDFFLFLFGFDTKAGLSLSLIGLASMIFIYIMTDLNDINWMTNFFIKKGVYSCLIILFWYNFCYSIFYVYLENNKYDKTDDKIKWTKRCGLGLSIVFGLCSLVFSYFFKDILICFLNFLIYIGLAIYFYIYNSQFVSQFYINTFDNSYYNNKYNYKNSRDYNTKDDEQGDGIVDFAMISLSFVLLVYLIAVKLQKENEETDCQVQIQNLQNEIQNMKNEYRQIDVRINDNENKIKEIMSNIGGAPTECQSINIIK